jgi:uncharacterized protein YbjT (DUF2867 family)
MSASGQDVILVTGATGNVGRQVVTQLLDAGARVRAVTRDPASARLPAAAEVIQADLSDPGSIRPHLPGVSSVFLLWPFLSADAAPPLLNVLAGRVNRMVYLSASAVHDDGDPAQNGVWGQVEQAIGKAGLDATFLRAGGFAANTLAWATQIRAGGVVRRPYGRASRSLIHERDIAAVATTVLTSTGHSGGKYVLTGPESVPQAEQAALIGTAIGRAVGWEEQPLDEARQQLAAEMGDASFAAHALDYWASLVDHPEPVTHTVEQLTGAPARTFAQWARDHAADFR